MIHKQKDSVRTGNAHTENQSIRKAELHVPGWLSSCAAHRIRVRTYAWAHTPAETLAYGSEDSLCRVLASILG